MQKVKKKETNMILILRNNKHDCDFDGWVDFRKSSCVFRDAQSDESLFFGVMSRLRSLLRSLSADAAGELNVFRHDGNTLGVNGAQVGVLEETNEVSLRSLLKGEDGRSLEAQVTLEVLGNLADETLEGELADEEVGGLLVPTDLAEGDGTGAVAVGLLHASGGGGGLARCLGGKLLAWGFASGGLACGLLSTSHFVELFCESDVAVEAKDSVRLKLRHGLAVHKEL
jgi:histone H3